MGWLWLVLLSAHLVPHLEIKVILNPLRLAGCGGDYPAFPCRLSFLFLKKKTNPKIIFIPFHFRWIYYCWVTLIALNTTSCLIKLPSFSFLCVWE